MTDATTRDLPQLGEYRTVRFTYRATAYDIQVGDRVVCMLSDAVAAVEVTGIRYEEVDLRRHGVTFDPLSARVVCEYRRTAAPWWVDRNDMTFDVTNERIAIRPADCHTLPTGDDLTRADIARQWCSFMDMQTSYAYALADAQVMLGYGRVDPATLSLDVWEHITKAVKGWGL